MEEEKRKNGIKLLGTILDFSGGTYIYNYLIISFFYHTIYTALNKNLNLYTSLPFLL